MAFTPVFITLLGFIGMIVTLTSVYVIERSVARVGAILMSKRTSVENAKF